MVLSSQAQRRGPRSYVSSFRRRKQRRIRRWLGTLVVLALVGYVAWYWMSDGDSASAPESESPIVSTDNTPQSAGATEDVPQPAIQPDRITQNSLTPPPPGPPESSKSTEPAPAPPTAKKPAPTPAKPAVKSPSSKPAAGPNAQTVRLLDAAEQLIAQGQTVKGRDLLNQALAQTSHPADAAAVRQKLTTLNRDLIFTPKVTPGDPWTETYIVQSGDVLANIAKSYNVPWEFISHINGDLDPRRLRVGARLKVVKGPFHAVVDKSDYRMDLYLGKPNPGAAGSMYVCSFKVGLGEYDATPVGEFIVKRHSKLKNPEWTNPRTGEKFLADDPKNPLGEYWIGLQGVDPNTEVLKGYGIHGTIDPDSIGTQASMGCVRLRDSNIKMVYAMLSEEISHVLVAR